MASWKDGPEYAPTRAPSGFDVPDVAPLPAAEPILNLAVGQPLEPPSSYAPVDAQPSLDGLAAAPAPARDPQQPFALAGTAATDAHAGAWGATHRSLAPGAGAGVATAAFDPRAPFRVQSRAPGASVAGPRPGSDFAPPTGLPVLPAAATATPRGALPPLPGAPAYAPPPASWYTGGTSPAPAAGGARATFADLWRAVTPAVWIGYGLAVLLGAWLPVAPIGFLLGFFGSFFIRYRIAQIRIVGVVFLGLQLFTCFVAMTLDNGELSTVWGVWNALAFVCSALALLLDGVLVWLALSHHERPERR